MQLFLIGPSGSGKDTQAKYICKKYDLKWISIGDVLRKRATIDDEIGRHIADAINHGNLLDWFHLRGIIEAEVKNNPKNFLWTGFPRLLEQAKYFDRMIQEYSSHLDLVINLSLDDENSKKRIEYRKNTDQNVREDDKAYEIIERRMNWYRDSIKDIEAYYTESKRFIHIDAAKGISEVSEDIDKYIKKFFSINE